MGFWDTLRDILAPGRLPPIQWMARKNAEEKELEQQATKLGGSAYDLTLFLRGEMTQGEYYERIRKDPNFTPEERKKLIEDLNAIRHSTDKPVDAHVAELAALAREAYQNATEAQIAQLGENNYPRVVNTTSEKGARGTHRTGRTQRS